MAASGRCWWVTPAGRAVTAVAANRSLLQHPSQAAAPATASDICTDPCPSVPACPTYSSLLQMHIA
jgi:hypothetical protein